MEFQPLHQYPEYLQDAAEVLNEEWKRSLTARLHSLEKSRDSFPVCLILLETVDDNKKHVVGHSRLSDVKGQTAKTCLIESVVVKKSHRGKGYGRIIMENTEKFAQSKGYEVMYLTTHDKQDFYKHLGFDFCTPIITMSTDIVPDHIAQHLLGNLKINSKPECKNENDRLLDNKNTNNNSNNTKELDRTISHPADDVPAISVPVAPPPPSLAPPPPPPLLKSSSQKSGDGKNVERWDPSKVSWMRKLL